MMIAVLALGTIAVAQTPAPQTTATGKMPEPPAIGVVFGKLADNNGKAVADASVILMGLKADPRTGARKEVVLKATTTKGAGSFRFEDLPIAGPLTLKISATGYSPIEKKFSFVEMPQGPAPAGAGPSGAPRPSGGQMPNFGAADFTKDLGRITMEIQPTELQNITITAVKPGVKMDIDRKIFNVDKNIVSAGGTAVDVMKNVPSVNVDMDGNVTLRNSAPQVYVDGRPTTLSLDQIPADAIESVEVITNPSAKYDASGGNSGILNIVLKKNKKSGYNGNVSLGTDKRGGINGGASLSVRQDKFNFNVAGFGNQMKNRNSGETHMLDLLANPNLLVDQYSQGRMNGGFMFGKVGMDYFATDRSSFSLSVIKVRGEFSPQDLIRSDSSLANGTYLSYSERNSASERIFNATGFQVGYKYLFPRQGEELTADVNSFQGRNESGQYFDTYVYGSKGGAYTGEQHQQILGNGTNRFTTIQTDYVRPLKDNKGKIEAGLRAQLRSLANSQSNYFQSAGGEFIKIPHASTNYKNYDNVYAAYISYTGKLKNFGYQIGLRGESSDYKGTITDTDQEFNNTYPLSLFPSIFLSQKLKNSQELQMSYTRRINRPFFLQLMPFIDSSNQANWTQGNAALRPEFTNSLEASYSKTYKGKNNFLASVYYKHTTGLITMILDTVSTSNGASHPVTTYINANSSYMAGLELTSQNYFTKWWDMNTNVNIYNSKINASGLNNEAMWSWFAKFNSNFKLPKNYSVQVSGTYQSKTNQPVNTGGGFGPPGMNMSQSNAQGYIKANYGFDVAVKKSFLKNNAASITLAATDIFQTRWNHSYTFAQFYQRESVRWPDSPMFRATFNYRFGKMDMSLFKRKNMKAEGESMQGLQM